MNLWLTWERHRRSIELAKAFDCDYREIDYAGSPRLIRYVRSALETVGALFERRYDAVFVQSPSIFLAALVALLRPIRRFKLIIDAHNAVPNYAGSSRRLLVAFVRFAVSRADVTIVTNEALCDDIRTLGGVPAVLPDKLPSIDEQPLPGRFASLRRPLITLIASFNWDEPIGTFLEAVARIEEDFSLVVTGRKSRAGDLTRFESERIIFSDWLGEGEFEGLIAASDLLIDLTVDERVLVCGAYEAVAVGVPVLLVDSAAARDCFPGGSLFSDNSIEGYCSAMARFFEGRAPGKDDMVAFRGRFEERWEGAFRPIADSVRGGGD